MSGVKLEIVTPKESFYNGQVQMLAVDTTSGSEGYMSRRQWCIKLLADPGKLKIVEEDGTEKFGVIHGGFVEIRDDFMIYTEKAEWK